MDFCPSHRNRKVGIWDSFPFFSIKTQVVGTYSLESESPWHGNSNVRVPKTIILRTEENHQILTMEQIRWVLDDI